MTVTVQWIDGIGRSILVWSKYLQGTIVFTAAIPTADRRNPLTLAAIDLVHERTGAAKAEIYDALREAWNLERKAAA